MPAVVRTDRDEHLWTSAKKRAAEEGHTKDYACIMGIYKRMKGLSKATPQGSTSKAPTGFSPIPNSKHGGFHKQQGGSYIYWYPGIGITRGSHAGDSEAGGKAAKVGTPKAAGAPAQAQAAQKQTPAPASSSKVPGAGAPAPGVAPSAGAKPAAGAAPAPASGAAPAGAAPTGKVITDPKELPPGFNDMDKKTRAVMTADWENVQKEMEDRFGPAKPYKGDLRKAIGDHLEELGRQGYIIPSNVEKAKVMMTQMAAHGTAAGLDEKQLAEVMEENVRKLAHQELESAGRTLGDHGVRHLSANARMSDAIFDQLQKGGQQLDPADRFMAYQAWIDHDMGYTIPAIARGGFSVKDNYHPQASAVLVMQQREKYEALLGKEKFEPYIQAVANHSGTAVDWKGDHFGSAIRLADNTHLFADKMPEVLFDSKPAVEALTKIRLAGELVPPTEEYTDDKGKKKKRRTGEEKAKFKALLGGVKAALSKQIEARTDLPPPSKAALLKAAQELGELTPTFLISRLAGRSPEFKFEGGDMNVIIEQSDARQTIGEVFGADEEDRQFAKLLKDYGTTPEAVLGGNPPPKAHIGDEGNGVNLRWEASKGSKDPAEKMHAQVMKAARTEMDGIKALPEGKERDAALDKFFGALVSKALREMMSLTGELDDWLEKANKEQTGSGFMESAEDKWARENPKAAALGQRPPAPPPPAPVAPRPVKGPSGYHPVPNSKHGGWRKRHGAGYIYWYPDEKGDPGARENTEPRGSDRAIHHRAMVEHHREKEREHRLEQGTERPAKQPGLVYREGAEGVGMIAQAKPRKKTAHELAADLHAGAANLHDWAVAAIEHAEGKDVPSATIRHLKGAGKNVDPEEAAKRANEWGDQAHAASEKANNPTPKKRRAPKPTSRTPRALELRRDGSIAEVRPGKKLGPPIVTREEAIKILGGEQTKPTSRTRAADRLDEMKREVEAGRHSDRVAAEMNHPKMVETIIHAAKTHGLESDPEHEVGDLQDAIRIAWPKLPPKARSGNTVEQIFRVAEAHGRQEGRGPEHEVGDLQAALRTIWGRLSPDAGKEVSGKLELWTYADPTTPSKSSPRSYPPPRAMTEPRRTWQSGLATGGVIAETERALAAGGAGPTKPRTPRALELRPDGSIAEVRPGKKLGPPIVTREEAIKILGGEQTKPTSRTRAADRLAAEDADNAAMTLDVARGDEATARAESANAKQRRHSQMFAPVEGDRWGGLVRTGVPKGQEYYQYDKEAFEGKPPTEAEFRKMKAAMALENAIENVSIGFAENDRPAPKTHPIITEAEKDARPHGINRRNYDRFASQATAFLLHLYDHGYTRGMIDLPYEAAMKIVQSGVKKSERIPGGLAAGRKPDQFDQQQLAAGIKVEREHTRDPRVRGRFEAPEDDAIAREIAMDHLTEDPDYYRKLRRMEKSGARGPAGYEPVPRSTHGGYRKRHGAGYVYWYPGKGVTTNEPHEADLAEHHRATGELQWKGAAEKLLAANKGADQEDLHYRAYLRAIVAGQPSAHLAEKFEGARRARSDLIDEWGKMGKSAMTAVAARTERVRPSESKPLGQEKPGLIHRIAAKLGKRPPGAGWAPVPGGTKGGYRKMAAGGYTYWYPGMKAEGGTQAEAEIHTKTEGAKKQIQHHHDQANKWRETSARRSEAGHSREAVEEARKQMHHHTTEAEKLRKEHGLENWRRSEEEDPTMEKAKAPLIVQDKDGKAKMPKLKPEPKQKAPDLPARKSVRMGSVDLGLTSDERVAKSLEDGEVELGVGVRHFDHRRLLNATMMKGTIYQGEAALPNQADDREQYMREQALAQTVEHDPAGNQGQGGDPSWWGFQAVPEPPTTVVDDTDPEVRARFRRRDY